MNLRLGTIIPAVLASLACLSLHAGDDGMKPNGCKGPTLCHAYPELDSNNFHMDIGFILEQMRITGTDYAVYLDNTYNTLPHNSGHLLRPTFDLDWGITAGLGYHFEHDDWFLQARFDWLRGKGKSTANITHARQIVPINIWKSNMISSSSSVTYFNNSTSTLTTTYFNLEVDLNKGSFVSGCFSFEPHAGLKVSWLYNSQNSNFTAGPSPAQSYDDLKRKQKSDFWGIGPMAGVDSSWHLAEGLSFFLDSSLAILFGQAKVSDDVSFSANPTTFHTFISDNREVMSPAAQALMGFKYQRLMYCDKQHIAIRMGLDTRYYWNQFNHINAIDNGSYADFHAEENGSFGMVGLLVDVGWEF